MTNHLHCKRCGRNKKRKEEEVEYKKEKKKENSNICGSWSTLAPMLTPRENFASDSGPDKLAQGSVRGVNQDPRVYAFGGRDMNGMALASGEKYNPVKDEWTPVASLPQPLADCAATFAPDYGGNDAVGLGFIYIVGGGTNLLFRYDILNDKFDTFPLPFSVSGAAIQFLDDFGGPLAALFIALTGVDIPACTDTITMWVVGGKDTEQQTWFIEMNTKGETVGDWAPGPDLPLFRENPLIGRTFWRDTGITSFGVSNCATIIVAGGTKRNGKISRLVQMLIRDEKNCNWKWITIENNPTGIPDELLVLALPVTKGGFGTEMFPEVGISGGKPFLFGGEPAFNNGGSTQFAQVRFTGGRYRADCVTPSSKDTLWKITTSMPIQRTNFRAAPLSQENSSQFGGRRVSRFVCIGGRDENGVTGRNQLFQDPIPNPFLRTEIDPDRCNDNSDKKKKCKKRCC